MWRLRILGIMIIIAWLASCDSEQNKGLTHIPFEPTFVELEKPSSVPQMYIPPENPMTVEGIELGRKLFYDPILSKDSTVFCGNCHQQGRSFTDGKVFSTGFAGRTGRRSAMSLVNIGFHQKGLFWDGRANQLEDQAIHPVQDSVEMNLDWASAVQRLQNHPSYPIDFRRAFGITKSEEITQDLIVRALAQFERTLISKDSKFDRWQRGEVALTKSEQRGYEIFFDTSEKLPHAECGHCHVDPLFTTLDFENNGIQQVSHLDEFPDKGRGEVTENQFDKGKFKVPTLINIAQTAPYMHDGRFKTLDEVIEHYVSGGHFSDNVSPNVRKLDFTEQDKQDLIAFLNTLTDSVFLNNPAFGNPFVESTSSR